MKAEIQQRLDGRNTILEILEGIRADLRSLKDGPRRANLTLELQRWEAKLKEVNRGFKSDLKSIEKQIEKAERKQYEQQIRNQYDDPRKRKKDKQKSDAHIDSLWDLRDSILRKLGRPIPKEVTKTSKYKTFPPWSKGRPTGQGKAKFWRGRP